MTDHQNTSREFNLLLSFVICIIFFLILSIKHKTVDQNLVQNVQFRWNIEFIYRYSLFQIRMYNLVLLRLQIPFQSVAVFDSSCVCKKGESG